MKVIKWNPLQVSSYCLFRRPSSKLVWINEVYLPLLGEAGRRRLCAVKSTRHCGHTVNPPHPEPGFFSSRYSMAHVNLDGQTDLDFLQHIVVVTGWPHSLSPGPFQKAFYSSSSSCFCYLLAIAMKICLLKFLFLASGFFLCFVSCSGSRRCPHFPPSLLSFIPLEGKGGIVCFSPAPTQLVLDIV